MLNSKEDAPGCWMGALAAADRSARPTYPRDAPGMQTPACSFGRAPRNYDNLRPRRRILPLRAQTSTARGAVRRAPQAAHRAPCAGVFSCRHRYFPGGGKFLPPKRTVAELRAVRASQGGMLPSRAERQAPLPASPLGFRRPAGRDRGVARGPPGPGAFAPPVCSQDAPLGDVRAAVQFGLGLVPSAVALVLAVFSAGPRRGPKSTSPWAAGRDQRRGVIEWRKPSPRQRWSGPSGPLGARALAPRPPGHPGRGPNV